MRILVATDGSPSSDYALGQAAALSSAYQAQAMVLCVSQPVDIGWYQPQDSWAPHTLEVPGGQEADEILQGAVRLFQSRGVTPEIRHRRGNPSSQILDLADEWHADLIVVGTHGRNRLDRFFLGSVSHQVITHAKCSVYLARDPARQGHQQPATEERAESDGPHGQVVSKL